MTPDQAAAALGLLPEEVNSLRSVKAAFARCVMAAHPDGKVSAEAWGVVVPGHTITAFKQARDVLIGRIANQNNACALCRGVGRVRAGMGWRRCAACEGSGGKG